MYRTKLGELTNEGKDESGYAETDPTGRYGRVSFLIIYICNFFFFEVLCLVDHEHAGLQALVVYRQKKFRLSL